MCHIVQIEMSAPVDCIKHLVSPTEGRSCYHTLNGLFLPSKLCTFYFFVFCDILAGGDFSPE